MRPAFQLLATANPRFSMSPPVGQLMLVWKGPLLYGVQPAALPSGLQLVMSYVPARAEPGIKQARARAISAGANARRSAKVVANWWSSQRVVFGRAGPRGEGPRASCRGPTVPQLSTVRN